MRGGVILAGGSDRPAAGIHKSLFRVGEETLIERQVREMRRWCGEIIVVTDDPRPLLTILDRNVRIITDYYRAQGPLVGFHAGLMLSTMRTVWVVGCDMPFIEARAADILFGALGPGALAAIPNVGGGLFPLHGVYDRSCASIAARLVEQKETSMSALLKSVNWVEVKESAFAEEGVPLRFVEQMAATDHATKGLAFTEM